jgi:hypothetical protein
MNVSVWDTFVQRKDNKTMHFDILVPSELKNHEKIMAYGKNYLSTKNFETENISLKKCQFCHIESASEKSITAITNYGFDIVEIENCN